MRSTSVSMRFASASQWSIERHSNRGRAGGDQAVIVLGIDAAWTEAGSSGVALLSSVEGRRKVLRVAPSYEAFVVAGEWPVDFVSWKKPVGGRPNVLALLTTAERIGGRVVDVVAMDMPISRKPIAGRRTADQLISRAFGAAGASTHSPTCVRPGRHGQSITEDFNRAGYNVVTSASRPRRALIEVYPLAALIRLMRLARRPAYKVTKTLRYWPALHAQERRACLRSSWQSIRVALEGEIGGLGFEPPVNFDSFAELKPYEDAMDALICCWVGACFGEGRAQPFGDEDAAIWVPSELDAQAAELTGR
jgi:predicted RNase H-like nuclease